MAEYLLKRVLLIIPTMIGIMAISFVIIQFAPGGPVERVIAQLTGTDVSMTSRIGGGGGGEVGQGGQHSQMGQGSSESAGSKYRGAQGLDPEFIKSLEKQFGFDKPALGAFTTMTFLTKNTFLDEIRKQYVITARAKGLNEGQVLYGHVFRNAMLLVIAGFPSTFIHAFFSGSLLIETIFSLDGIGLLGFESIDKRDYPVVFATLYIFALLGLVMNLVTDFVYTLVDPRIDFESRGS